MISTKADFTVRYVLVMFAVVVVFFLWVIDLSWVRCHNEFITNENKAYRLTVVRMASTV